MIEVVVRPPFAGAGWEARVRRAVRATLDAEGSPAEPELSVVLTGDCEIQELNRQYRGHDAPTDVLAFGEEPDHAGFVSAPDEPLYLGDVVISVPRAAEQAKEQGYGTAQELELLVVHGVLHLLGYDHAGDQERGRMWARQDAILADLGEFNEEPRT
jgi:rRNA maturation RNase YbeY